MKILFVFLIIPVFQQILIFTVSDLKLNIVRVFVEWSEKKMLLPTRSPHFSPSILNKQHEKKKSFKKVPLEHVRPLITVCVCYKAAESNVGVIVNLRSRALKTVHCIRIYCFISCRGFFVVFWIVLSAGRFFFHVVQLCLLLAFSVHYWKCSVIL